MIQSFKMALRSISGNRMRAALTMLGIIIGVMALVVLVSLVNGATSSVTDAVSGLGSSMLTVTVSDSKGKPLDLATLSDWEEQYGELGPIAASTAATAVGKYGGSNATMTLYGVTPAYFQVEGLTMSMGRWLRSADLDNGSYVCVVNETAAEELVGYTDCVGEEISLNGVKYTVVGVLGNNDDSLTAVFTSNSKVAYIPYTSLIRLSDSVSREIGSFSVGAAEGRTLEDAETRMQELLMERFDGDEDAFDLSSQNVLEDAMSSITSVLTILLGGIAAISLIVGGIGIMNIMLVTVTERTREIGIRKAIGASRGSILMQFLMEAVVLCMLGCALGIFCSWSILRLVSAAVSGLSLRFELNGGVVWVSVIFCFMIGVIFGLYPANKAAKMKPIDALHYGG
ncbi:MAG: ABC transporter permease [bacterium]|nr:ABC transporter permease [bacterium]